MRAAIRSDVHTGIIWIISIMNKWEVRLLTTFLPTFFVIFGRITPIILSILFYVQYPDDERVVKQFHFTAWPDHGVPSHPTPLLSLVRHTFTANRESIGPMLVHCRYGVLHAVRENKREVNEKGGTFRNVFCWLTVFHLDDMFKLSVPKHFNLHPVDGKY